MQIIRTVLLMWAVLGAITAPVATRAETVTVYAAASLRDALDEILTGWSAATGHETRLSAAGSSVLARQIQAGAPADLFVSANLAWMQVLEQEALLTPGTQVDLARNRLVLVGDAGTPAVDLTQPGGIADRLGRRGRLAMALVQAVPAGIYGRQALETLGHWDEVAPRVAQADNVRAALTLVLRGAAPLGIVYATDVRVASGLAVLAEFPAESHDPIVYPMALVGSQPSEPARALWTYLQDPQAQAILAAQGFGPGGAP